MADASPINGSNGANGKAWTNWPSLHRAARTIGINVKKCRMLVETGDLPAFKGDDGTLRFDPVVLQELGQELRDLPDNEDDITNAKSADQAAERIGVSVEAVRGQGAFVKQLIDQNKELHEELRNCYALMQQTWKSSSEVNEKTLHRLLEELELYRRAHSDVLQAREQAADESAARELALREQTDRINRRQQVLTIAKDQAGKLVEIVAAKFGISKATLEGWNAERLRAVVEFFTTLDPAQIEIALTSGFFTPQQCEALKRIVTVEPTTAEPPTPKESEPCESQPAEKNAPQQPSPG